MTEAEAIEFAKMRQLLGWVFYRSRFGCFSHKRSERDAALSDVNYWSEPYMKFYTSPMNPERNGRLYFGETP